MLHTNTHQYERVSEERLRDCLRRADVDCVCRQAGIDQRGWTARQLCRLIAGLGSRMVMLGRRMERIDLTTVNRTTLHGAS